MLFRSPTCKTTQAFSIMAIIFSFAAFIALFGGPKLLSMGEKVSNIPLMPQSVIDLFSSSTVLVGLALVSTFVYFMVTILAGSGVGDAPGKGGFMYDNKSIVDMSNKDVPNSVELVEGFHMSWAAMVCFIIALVAGGCDCAELMEEFKKVW